MKALYSTFIFLLSCVHGFAQVNDVMVLKSRLSNVLTVGPGNRYAEGFDNRTSGVVGDQYLFNTWFPGYVIFNDDARVNDLLLKYDLLNQKIEIKLEDMIKVGDENQIKEFHIFQDNKKDYQKYISLLRYKKALGEDEFIGYAEVLYEGNVMLLKKPYILVQEPNYREGLDVGRKDLKLLQREKLYLVENGSIVEMKNGKSFQNHKKAVKSFIKINKINLNSERHLRLLVEYYDSL